MQPRIRAYLLIAAQCVALVAIGVALYAKTLDRPMNSVDDRHWLDDVKERDTLAKMFDPTLRTKNSFATTYYLPSQSLLYWTMDRLFERTPKPYRILALMIHLANTVLLLLLIYALSRSFLIAFPSASLFLAHSAHQQSVTWVPAAYSHPLATTFILLSVIGFERFVSQGRKRRWLVLSFVSFFVGWTIRETLIVVPVILVMLEIALNVSDSDDVESVSLKHRVLPYIAYLAITIPFVIIALYKYPLGKINQSWGGVSIGSFPVLRFLDFSSFMVWPATLSISAKLTICGALIGVATLALYHAKQVPKIAWSIVWITVALAPYTISNFNTVGAVTRYLYPGLVGLCLFLAMVAARFEKRSPGRIGAIAAIGVVALIYLYKGFV